MSERRIVVTGMGAVSCLGNDVPSLWRGLIAGKSGIGQVTLFPADGLPCAAGEVRDLVLSDTTLKEERRMARFVRFAVAAADEAMRVAGLARLPEQRGGDPFRFGTLVPSGAGGVDEYDLGMETLKNRGPGGVSAFFVPKFMSNGASGTIAVRYGLKGPNFDPVSACASGAHAIGEAMWMIKRDDADIMLAGGTEACLNRMMMSGFHSLTALSCAMPPERACRPFDRDRDGFVLAEGAAMLVLEELEHARCRNAKILAELVGYGATCDASHITAPDPEARGMSQAIRNALARSGASPDSVGCVIAHGTGTIANDRCEAKALHHVFGAHAKKLKVSAIKSMIGHALAASGALSAVAAVRTLCTGTLPPTINFRTPDPECALDVTPNHAAHVDTEYVLIDSLGFGGHNAALLFRKWEDE